MKLKTLVTTLLLSAIVTLSASLSKAESRNQTSQILNSPATREQVLAACVQNRAETLPNPYTDVAPTHWAYKAVLSLYYCGAYREATPPALLEQLLQSDRPISPHSGTGNGLSPDRP